MKIAFLTLTCIVILGTVLPFLPSTIWWIRALEFPRYQLVLLGIIPVILLYFLPERESYIIVLAILLIIAMIYQSSKIFPYTFMAKKQVLQASKPNDNNTISLIITNVLMYNRNYKGLLNIIHVTDPDIILAQEVNSEWVNALSELEKKYSYCVMKPMENTYGMVLYSRLKLIEPTIKYLVKDDIPSIHTRIELRSNVIVEAHFLHPKPPAPEESEDSKERDAEILIVGKQIRKTKLPVIVAGDLNDVAWSETTSLFQKISGLLDPRVGRGFFNTFHADYFIFRWPLDYVFHSNHFTLIELERQPHFGSDHFPVFIKLQFENKAEEIQEEPKPNKTDVKESNEKIEKGVQK